MNATRLALALLASLMLAACNTGNVPTFQGWIEAELIFVGPDETGRIQTLAVRQGDRVEQGAPLFAVAYSNSPSNAKPPLQQHRW